MVVLRIIVAGALIVGAGLVQGMWTHRWGTSPELSALAARFDSLPMKIGDWTATPVELGERQRQMAGAAASLSRDYTLPGRGVSVSVMLLGGLPGDIASHTPDACYPGAGYVLTEPAPFLYRPRGDGPGMNFRTATATRGGANPSVLRIFWSWRSSKGWSAPEVARWQFASEPMLSKLYVVRETGGAAVEPDRDPCKAFLDVFLPELDRAVFSPSR